ncbi:MAG: hypothetical protein RIM84_02325 [Alphaproteobacteria bacterium]
MSDADSLNELLAAHFRRFQASHQRARGQAGPSLFGSDRAVDHWTFDYAKRAIDEAIADAVAYALANDVGDPSPALRHFVDDIQAALKADADAPPANEFGLRPSPAALEDVRRHGAERLSMAQASLTSGRIDPRLKPPARRFGNDKLVLFAVVAVVILAVLATI